MSIAFTRAKEVAPGQAITSAQHNSLARAINDRILSGLGDPAFRIVEYLFGLFRAVLAGETTGATHAEAEWFDVYQNTRPNVANWPLTGVDPESGLPEPNGPNVANPVMAWVYGNKSVGLDNEALRLSQVPVAYPTDTPELKWATAKVQRGAKDPLTGYTVSPIRELAEQFAKLAFRKDSVHGVSFGGFLPGPDQITGTTCDQPCDLATCDQYRRDDLDIYFTATRPDVTGAGMHFSVIDTGIPWPQDPTQTVIRGHYAGTCAPCDGWSGCSDVHKYDDHIDQYYELPAGWTVRLNDGTEDVLPHNDWIEGPYQQLKQVGRDYGDQVRRMVNAFNREFRGSTDQLALTGYNLEAAFDFQAVFTRQFALAPARGVQTGNELQIAYPSWTIGEGSWAAGRVLPSVFGGSSYSWHAGHAATHFFCIVRTATTKMVNLTVTHSAGTFDVPVTEAGLIVRLDAGVGLYDVTVKLKDATVFAAGESVLIEFNEVEEYKPNWSDIYAVLRKGGAKLVGASGGELASANLDGSGTEEEQAQEIGAEFLANGCVVNIHEVTGISEPTSENENAVYEAARRLSRSVRVFNRFLLLDYAVEGGDSILWFTPYPRTAEFPMAAPWDDGDTDVDVFEDMAIVGEQEGAFSQRWVMDCWLKPYAEGTVTLDAYADWFADVNRCLFLDVKMYDDRSMAKFIDRGNTADPGNGSVFAQAPSGWNYAQLFNSFSGSPSFLNHNPGAMSDDERTRFAKSCRVYEPPVEVRKIERVTENGRNLVKVTMKGRVHNTNGESGGAPDSIPRHGWMDDPAGTGNWDWATVEGEATTTFRSTENALRLYLFYRWKGYETTALAIGDYSANPRGGWASPALYTGQHPACIPHFYFVQLIPEAWVDTNDDQDVIDSLFTHDAELQAEWYLRCMSEGCVAGVGALKCDDETLPTPNDARAYDWKWANLCNHLFGFPSVSSFGSAATKDESGITMLATTDVRPDGPEGFGPLPNTYASSEVFNRLVRIVNELNRFRVMIPWQMETRAGIGQDSIYFRGLIDYGCGTVTECGAPPVTGGDIWCAVPFAGPSISGVTWGAWSTTGDTSFSGGTSCGLSADEYSCGVSPNTWGLTTQRSVVEFRFGLLDEAIYTYALPPKWRDMVSATSPNLGAVWSITHNWYWAEKTTGAGDCPPSSLCTFEAKTRSNTECVFMRNGTVTLDAGPDAPGGWKAIAWGDVLCAYGTGHTITMYLLSDTIPILEVPVVDMPEWAVQPWITP